VIDDSLYERVQKTQWDDLPGLCGCGSGGIFIQSRHVDLMGNGWHLNHCASPDSIVRYEDKILGTKSLVLTKESVLFNQIGKLKNVLKKIDFQNDSAYVFSDRELKIENVKKGIYVASVPIPDNIRVSKNVRLLKVYYPNGKLAHEIQFFRGVKNGYDKIYYTSGNKYIVHYFKDGLMNGRQIKYYQSGRKKEEIIYRNGVHSGLLKYYSEENGFPSKKVIDENIVIGW
jgi:antitoxin component YwqK of YwqJK toxin-antitoxin module